MRRWAAILMLLGIVGLATGTLDYLHQMQHARQAAEWMAAVRAAAARTGQQPVELPKGPSQNNCVICLMLHAAQMPLAQAVVIPLLALLAVEMTRQAYVVFANRFALPISLRGPPLCA